MLYSKDDESDAIYFVLNGRLRSLQSSGSSGNRKAGSFYGSAGGSTAAGGEAANQEVIGEHGQGESVGDLEVLTETPYRDSVFAVRDSELARIPRLLFRSLTTRFPQVTIQTSRMVAVRSQERLLSNQSGARQRNLRTVALLPASAEVPIEGFARDLHEALAAHSPSLLLSSAVVLKHLGKAAFNRVGNIKLISWLEEMEESHRTVVYLADQVNSTWTRRCIRQADVILVVALGARDSNLGDFELLLQRNVKTTARKELVLLHAQREVPSGTTYRWLSKRPWVHTHHHVQLQAIWSRSPQLNDYLGSGGAGAGAGGGATPSSSRPGTPASTTSNYSGATSSLFKSAISNNNLFASPMRPLFAPIFGAPPMPVVHTPSSVVSTARARSDVARLARHLTGRSVGVVLGGGGARGFAHVGVLKALEEAGIPVDLVGGTSMGAFISALYARDPNHITTLSFVAKFSTTMASSWNLAFDLTYPVAAWLSGRSLNTVLSRCLGQNQMIEVFIKL